MFRYTFEVFVQQNACIDAQMRKCAERSCANAQMDDSGAAMVGSVAPIAGARPVQPRVVTDEEGWSAVQTRKR